ncbi:MAG: alpha/beta hydrolase, partial [Phenylobacterium sp.]
EVRTLAAEALKMIKARQELFSAYVGASQAVGGSGNQLGYELALQAARARKDTAGVAALERVGPPPYRTFEDFLVRQTYSNPPGQPMSPAEVAATADVGRLMSAPAPDARYIAFRTNPPGYEVFKVFFATQRALFQETWAWDAHHLGVTFKVPVFIFQGENDFNTPMRTAREYFDEIKAPAKAFEVIPGAGHNTPIFHAELLALLKKDVLPVIQR